MAFVWPDLSSVVWIDIVGVEQKVVLLVEGGGREGASSASRYTLKDRTIKRLPCMVDTLT